MRKLLFAGISMVVVLGLVAMTGIVGCESSDNDNDSVLSTELSIIPSSLTITAATVTNVQLTATGGTSNYTWSVDKPALGSVVSQGGIAIYTSTTNVGVNFVTVTDSATNTISATITQK